MSTNANLWPDLNGGTTSGGGSKGGGNTTTIVILLMSLCCCVMLGVGLAVAWQQGWLNKIGDWFKNNKNDDDNKTDNNTIDNSTNNNQGGNTIVDTFGAENTTGKMWVCPAPWDKGELRYDSASGWCCKDGGATDSSGCDAALEVGQDWTVDDVTTFHTYLTKERAGRIIGGAFKGTCPGPIGNGATRATDVQSVVAVERKDSKSNTLVSEVGCWPVDSKDKTYWAGTRYGVSPACNKGKNATTYVRADTRFVCQDKSNNPASITWKAV